MSMPSPAQTNKIANWRASLPAGDELRVVFGGHWDKNPGWLLLNESDQDICQPLDFPDNSVDVVFTEHVFEHVDFCGAVIFLQEALRILKPGGVFRLVAPMLDSVLSADLSTPQGQSYVHNSLKPYFPKEQIVLEELLGLGGLYAGSYDFFINSMFRLHGHQFIWSSELVMKVMKRLGYQDVQKKAVGEGVNPDYCIERRKRGIYMGSDWPKGMEPPDIYDLESTVVEARK